MRHDDPKAAVRLVAHPHVDTSRGEPVVAGSEVPVSLLWAYHRRGMPVALMVRRFPQLGPAKILGALAFAYDNRSLLEAEMALDAG